jgi:hypothetical protein
MPVLNLSLKQAPELRLYSHILRCIGQSLEHHNFKAFEVKCEDRVYFVQGWHRGTSNSVGVKERYTVDDLIKLEIERQKSRRVGSSRADPLSLSQLLRTAGNYVDLLRGRLLRVEWQYQSDKVQSITIQYQPRESERQGKDFPLGAIDEVCVHVYRERKKARPLSVRPVSMETPA